MVEHSAVNYTAEHHKPLFWRRLATKLSPLLVPQLCPAYLERMLGVGSTPVNSSISHNPVDCHFSVRPFVSHACDSDNRFPVRANQLFPFRYLSNHATVRRIESIWFSRFSKPWPSFA